MRRNKTVLERLKKERRELERGLEQEKLPPTIENQMDELSESIVEQQKTVTILTEDLTTIDRKYKKLNSAYIELGQNPQQAIRRMKTDPDLTNEVEISQHLRNLEAPLSTKNQILNSSSRFIDNDKRFVEEYLTRIRPFRGRGGSESLYAGNWMSNSNNLRKLEELRSGGKIGKILQDVEVHGKEVREALGGLVSSSIANKLKIGGTMAASIVAPIAIMSWFDDTSDVINIEAQKTRTGLGELSVSGEAGKIVSQARLAAEDAEDAIADTERGLGGDNPGAAAEDYINRLIRDKQIIDQSIAQWDRVTELADNKEAATIAGIHLQTLSATIGTSLKKAGKVVKNAPIPGGVAGKKIPKDKIIKLQLFLRDQSIHSAMFIYVTPSGVLDKPTIQALKRLEQEFNQAQETTEFTGLLYSAEKNHLIGVEDLKKLEQTIQRGR